MKDKESKITLIHHEQIDCFCPPYHTNNQAAPSNLDLAALLYRFYRPIFFVVYNKINTMRHFYLTFLFLFSLACFSQTRIDIDLHPRDTLNLIPSDFAGLSFEKNCLNKGIFGPAEDTLTQLFLTCGIKSMRVGANAVDTDQLSEVADSLHFTRGELDALFQFAQGAGCKILLGLNLRDYNVSLAETEASYVIQKYPGELLGFEVGNEPDLYNKHGYRKPPPPLYTVIQYEEEFKRYYDTITKHQPTAVFTGPGCASRYTEWTEPFCNYADTLKSFSMLTQHYYGGDTNAVTISERIDTLLSKEKLKHLSKEVGSLVKCAGHIPFRMSECNSWDDGGKKGVSNAFASALWALDFMYQLAYDSCAGVNFHGGLSGWYTVFSRYDNIYHARPIAYGILAFQIGSKGRFIKETVGDYKMNLDSYSVIDSSGNIFTTIINKDLFQDAVINLAVRDAENNNYLSAEYVRLSSDALGDTTSVTLGGKVVDSKGIIPPYDWLSLPDSSHMTQLIVPSGSAVVVKFKYIIGNSINDYSKNNTHFLNLYPNPASDKVTIITDMTEHSVISIYNLQGEILLQQQIQQSKTNIDISGLAKGVYILRLNSNAWVEVSKLIKE
jgi:hypothetical protein